MRNIGKILQANSTNSRIEATTFTKIDMDPVEPIWPSKVLDGLNEKERLEFIKTLASQISAHINLAGAKKPVDFIRSIVPEELDKALSIDDITKRIFQNKALADHFPTIKLKSIPFIQAAAFDMKPDRKLKTKPFADFDGNSFDLSETDCSMPKATHEKLELNSKIYTRDVPIDRDIQPCFHANSRELAKIFNVLSEQMSGNSLKKVTVRFSGAEVIEVTSLADLVEELERLQYVVEIYSTRVFVDFLGFAVRSGIEEFSPLVIPTRFSQDTSSGKLVLPGEHSEIGMMLYRDGEPRFAQLRFFFGIPDKAYPGKVAFWRPHTSKYPKWRKPLHDLVERFEGANLNRLEPWLASAAQTMNAFQAVQDEVQLPYNSYGFAVCNDSAATVVAVHDSKVFRSVERRTWAFPLIRAGEFTSPSGLTLNYTSELTRRIPLDLELFERTYPSDFKVDAGYFKTRISRAFPVESDRLLEYFPEVHSVLKNFE